MKPRTLKFSKDEHGDFIIVLRKRVNTYFTENKLKKQSNGNMIFKTIFMLSLTFVPYAFMISGMVTNYWLFIGMWVLMGMGTSGIGLSIMHDANHGSYSKNKRVNWLLSHLLELIGGSSRNWKIQHNKLHHTFTNVEGHDEDIRPHLILRFAPSPKTL